MRVYLNHFQNVLYDTWGTGTFPAHFAYGATHLGDYGIDVVVRRHRFLSSRVALMIETACHVLFARRRYDAVYAPTSYFGLEIVIFLRALRLFRGRIVVWHHKPVITPPGRLRNTLGRLFYRGIDDFVFFSEKIARESTLTRKVPPERVHIGHWGPDLDFYDRVLQRVATDGGCDRRTFISTGKERRDMTTLVEAFNRAAEPIDIYTTRGNMGSDYAAILGATERNDNVRVHFTEGFLQGELCYKVARAGCVCVCCRETDYTVGLTTVVEALALGLPLICSRNPQIPIDIDGEGCGISVPYGDVDAWVAAIRRIADRPDEAAAMGRRGRALAERRFNDRLCAREIAAVLQGKSDR